MYSVVLLTAMATASTTPAGHGWFHGCNGCYGYAPYSSYSGYGGYAPYSSYSSYGCYGCYGCGGCWGGGYAPHYGGYGAGFGYHGGCYGAYGVWQGDPHVYGGCFGCHGGQSGYGIPLPVMDGRPALPGAFVPIEPTIKKPLPPGPEAEEIVIPKVKKVAPPPEPKKPEEQVRVKVRIDVPEGGRLFVDGHHINATGSRLFQTPLLAPGQKYFYDVRVEINRNGQVISEQRRVIVEPGLDVAVAFPNLTRGTTTAQVQE